MFEIRCRKTHRKSGRCNFNECIQYYDHSLSAQWVLRFVRVAYSSLLQCAPAIAPTHFNERVRVSKCYGRSILEHVRACDANKLLVSVWSIFLNLTEYANQRQELTERSVSVCSTECTQCHYALRKKLEVLAVTWSQVCIYSYILLHTYMICNYVTINTSNFFRKTCINICRIFHGFSYTYISNLIFSWPATWVWSLSYYSVVTDFG